MGGDGIDLSRVLTGDPITSRPPLFWAYGKQGAPRQPGVPSQPHDVSPRYAVRAGDWKLLANAGATDVPLYQLASEPRETTAVATRNASVRYRLLGQLKAWMGKLPKYQIGREPGRER